MLCAYLTEFKFFFRLIQTLVHGTSQIEWSTELYVMLERADSVGIAVYFVTPHTGLPVSTSAQTPLASICCESVVQQAANKFTTNQKSTTSKSVENRTPTTNLQQPDL